MLNFSSTLYINETTNPIVPIGHYIIISIWSIGSVTSFINILVFIKLINKDNLYKYLLLMCTADFLYMFTYAYMFIYRVFCNGRHVYSKCSTVARYIDLFNEHAIDEYFTSILAILNISMEIFLTLDRLFLVINVKLFRSFNPNIVILLLCVFGILYYLPIVFLYKIEEIRTNLTSMEKGYTLTYDIVRTDYGKSRIGVLTPTILSLTRIVFVVFVLFSLNIVNIFKYKDYFDKKINKSSKLY